MFQLLPILVTSPCLESIIEELGIKNWPIWTYDDKEIRLLLAGEVMVTPNEGEPVKIW